MLDIQPFITNIEQEYAKKLFTSTDLNNGYTSVEYECIARADKSRAMDIINGIVV
jgi:hypothetical protein